MQFSSRDSWTPTFTTPNPSDRTELPHLSSLHAPGAKTTSLQLPTPTVQILSSNSLIPFSFFLCQRKQKLLFRNKAAEENHSTEGTQRKNLKNPCKLIKECGSIRVPGQKMRMQNLAEIPISSNTGDVQSVVLNAVPE